MEIGGVGWLGNDFWGVVVAREGRDGVRSGGVGESLSLMSGSGVTDIQFLSRASSTKRQCAAVHFEGAFCGKRRKCSEKHHL